jgi:hypothetical protein
MPLTHRESFALQELRKAAEGVDWSKVQQWAPYAGALGLGLGAYALMPRDQELWGLGGLAAGGLAGRLFGDYMAGGSPLKSMEDMGNEVGNIGQNIWRGIKNRWSTPEPPTPTVKAGSPKMGLLLELLLKHAADGPVFNSAQKAQLPSPGIQAPAKNTTQQMGGTTQLAGSVTSQQGPRDKMPVPYGTAT